jgi:hypothetical protein
MVVCSNTVNTIVIVLNFFIQFEVKKISSDKQYFGDAVPDAEPL